MACAGDTEISNQSLYESMGMDRRDFTALTRKPEWHAHIANLGLASQRRGKGRGMGCGWSLSKSRVSPISLGRFHDTLGGMTCTSSPVPTQPWEMSGQPIGER